MEILACIKRVPITGSQLILTSDGQSLQTDSLGYGISPHEENAVDRKSTRLNSSHTDISRMPSSA